MGRFFFGRRGLALAGVLALCTGDVIRAAETPDRVHAFLQSYCLECHGAEKQKGDRRFDGLTLPVDKADTLVDLQDIVDELNLGEMPPKKSKQPGPEETHQAIALLTGLVSEGVAKLSSHGGQSVLRRLNRREYLNTVGDLFGLNMLMFDPTTKFPRDQVVQHMDNVGDALQTSSYLLGQYLDAADRVVEKTFAVMERPKEQTLVFNKNSQQQEELRRAHESAFNYRYLVLYDRPAAEKPEGAYAPIFDYRQGAPVDGWYEMKVKAAALNRKNPYNPALFGLDLGEPFRMGVVAGDEKAGMLHTSQPLEPVLAEEVVVKDNVEDWYTFRIWLDAGFTPRLTFPNGALNTRGTWIKILREYSSQYPLEIRKNLSSYLNIAFARGVVLKYGFMPQIRVSEVQIRGPIVSQWPPPAHQVLLGHTAFAPEHTRALLEAFASRAYRRPARTDEVDRLMTVVQQNLKQGLSPFDAFKGGMKAALCSPAFLYLAQPSEETGGTAYALASRLSYFLWSSMPDGELRRLAIDGSLAKPEILRAQTRRLLASPKSEAFVEGFLDSWLNLRSLGDMAPDRDEFKRYYSDALQPAMRRETQLFTRDLIDRNQSIVRFLDADYTFANRPLAQLYGLENAVSRDQGAKFQKIHFDSPERGGLLGQGSILTVSANGVETSPVTRGVWLLENILGTPPAPPPDNVPSIDPDVRGATTMRDILTKHRTNPACYDCHRKIDPLGFALESFDPIGAWRTQYAKGLPIDTSGELPDGQKFKDLAELKKILVGRKEQFARMLTERLLTYGSGRQLEPLDRLEVNRIVKVVAEKDYGFRDLLEEIVQSKAFQ